MFDVFFYEAFAEEAQTIKKYLPAEIKAGFSWETVQEKKEDLPAARLISIRTQSRIPAEWGNQLTAILSRSTGYDHLLRYQSLIRKPLILGYLPLYCNRAVAEQAMLLWMALLRKLPRQIVQFSDFNRDGLTGWECENKTLLVVGVGNIGSQVAKIGQGLGMKVLGVDLVRKFEFVDYFSIEEALPRAEIIVCAMNLTKENPSYFNYDRLKQAPKGVIFINIARGEFSPAVDLLQLLDEGHLAGLGMDVYNRESELAVMFRSQESITDRELLATRSLSQKSNVIFTPHNAFNTMEAVERKSLQSVEQIKYFLKNGKFLWPLPQENF